MFPQRKGTWCPLNRMLGRHWFRSGVCGLAHNKRLLPGIEQRSLGRPNRSLFPVLTELHRIPLIKVNNWRILTQKRCKWKYSVYARVLCSALWGLLRSKLSPYGRLQHKRKFPGIAEQFNLIPNRLLWYKICESTTVNKVSMRICLFISICTHWQNPSLNNQGRWEWVRPW
jgi:hypothetical protein